MELRAEAEDDEAAASLISLNSSLILASIITVYFHQDFLLIECQTNGKT
uniref:Uncharacterized protein n=1 Tax=Rhizophora mucronata TaxID=61149 RepID=A0A2P2QTU3_RHIMU